MEEKMAVMQEKMDRMVAKSRKGNVQGQEKQTLINQLKVDLKDERAAHMALQEAKTLVDIQWAYELDRLEGVLVKLNEKAETYKMAFQEEETRRVSAIQAANIRVKRVTIEAEEARKEHQRQIRFAKVRQIALERELRRQVRQRNTSGLYQAELEMKLYMFDETKQKEFDVLRTKLRKARENHQDDLESLSILWPPAEDGYLLPTILKPFTDVVRIEQDRKRLLERTKAKGLEIPAGEESDTDSDDEEAHVARRDMMKELKMYREEALMPSLRVLDPEEKPRFKAVSMTPRRRRYVLYDTPRLYQPPLDERNEGNTAKDGRKALSNDEDEVKSSHQEANNYELEKFQLSARSDASSIRSETSSQAIAAAVRLRLQLPPALAQHRPATMLAAIATKDYGAEPWDSDDDTARNEEAEAAERRQKRQNYLEQNVIKKNMPENSQVETKKEKIHQDVEVIKIKSKPKNLVEKSSEDTPTSKVESITEFKDTISKENINPEVQLWFEDFLNGVEVSICKRSIKMQETEIKNLTNELLNKVEFRETIKEIVKDIAR